MKKSVGKAKPPVKKETMAQYEKSSADKRADKRELAAINKKRMAKK